MTKVEITLKLDCSREGISSNRVGGNRWGAIFGYNTGTEHIICLEEPLYEHEDAEWRGGFGDDFINMVRESDRVIAVVHTDTVHKILSRELDLAYELGPIISKAFFSYD